MCTPIFVYLLLLASFSCKQQCIRYISNICQCVGSVVGCTRGESVQPRACFIYAPADQNAVDCHRSVKIRSIKGSNLLRNQGIDVSCCFHIDARAQSPILLSDIAP